MYEVIMANQPNLASMSKKRKLDEIPDQFVDIEHEKEIASLQRVKRHRQKEKFRKKFAERKEERADKMQE